MTSARVNPLHCQAFGTCARVAPQLFSLDDWGYAVVAKGELEGAEEIASMEEAIRECPAAAILWTRPPSRPAD